MNLFQRIGMRVATVVCLGGVGAPACAPTAAQRQAGIDEYVRANAPYWVFNAPSGTVVGQSSCSPESVLHDYSEYLEERHEAARDANAAVGRQYGRRGTLSERDAEVSFDAICTQDSNGTVLSSKVYLLFRVPSHYHPYHL